MPTASSTSGYRAAIGASQYRHFPRRKIHPNTGMLSFIASLCRHFGQYENSGVHSAVNPPSGIRYTTTFRKLPTHAPKTGGSFLSLVHRKFFDGLTFHRIVPGFVIQGGDPQGTGQGGPGYSVVEAPPQSVQYRRGTAAMAKTQTEPPGTSGSQFFVVVAPNASGPPFSLPPDYALLGKVTKGLDVVQRIGVLPIDPSTETPRQPVVITSAKLVVG